jgi:hypothetical protein
VADRQPHKLDVTGSNPVPAPNSALTGAVVTLAIGLFFFLYKPGFSQAFFEDNLIQT